MIQGLIIKKVLDLVMKTILKKYNLDKIKSYVEDDNECDVQIKQMQKTIAKQGKQLEDNDVDIAILKKNTHPKKNIKCSCKCRLK